MENIIGLNNRISVQWSLLTTEGEPFGLDGYQLILRAFSGRGRTDITGVTISGESNNVVSWVMEAKELHYTGFFSLSLVLMKGNVRFATVTYKDAFRVSSRFDDHCSCTQQIHLKSYVNVIHTAGFGDGINEIMIGEDGPYSPPAGSRRVTLPEYPSRESLGLAEMTEQIDDLDERVKEIEEHGSGGSSVDWNQIQETGIKIAEIRIGEGSPVSVFAPQQARSIVTRTDYYQAGTSRDTAPTGQWTEDVAPSDYGPAKPYLWRKTLTVYSDGNEEWSPAGVVATWGETGAPGDETDTVYAMSDVSLPISVTILDNTPSQDDTFLPTFVFAYSDSTSVQTLTTRAIPSLSEAHRFRFKSVRKRVNGVWGAFSAPALDANYSVASLTQEEIDAIKSDVQSAIEEDLSSAIARINSLEAEFEGIEDDLGGITQNINSLTGRLEAVEVRTVWTEEDIAHIADVQIDAAEGTIKAWAAEKTEDMFTDAGITIDGVAGVVEQFTDFRDEDGELTTVRAWLDSHKGEIGSAATKAYVDGELGDVREEMTLGDEAAILQSVTKAHFLMDDDGLVDTNGNPLYYKGSGTSAADRIYFDGNYYYTDPEYTTRYTGTKYRATYPENMGLGYTNVEGLSFIRQNADSIVLGALNNISPENAAYILLQASQEGETAITLNADVITFKGNGTFEGSASIQSAWIDACQITNCTIVSDLKSANYTPGGSEGFFIDGETGSAVFHDISINSENSLGDGLSIEDSELHFHCSGGGTRTASDVYIGVPDEMSNEAGIIITRLSGSQYADIEANRIALINGGYPANTVYMDNDGFHISYVSSGSVLDAVMSSDFNLLVLGAPPSSGADSNIIYFEV